MDPYSIRNVLRRTFPLIIFYLRIFCNTRATFYAGIEQDEVSEVERNVVQFFLGRVRKKRDVKRLRDVSTVLYGYRGYQNGVSTKYTV